MQNADCTYICEQFTDYQDNSLSITIRAKVDTHLASCPICKDLFLKLNNVVDTLHRFPTVKTSENFTSTLLSRIDTMNQETAWQKIYHSSYTRVAGYAIAAGLVVAIGINVLIDPKAPIQRGFQSGFAEEQQNQITPVESLVEVADSVANPTADSLTLQNSTINPQNQSMQLVSGKK